MDSKIVRAYSNWMKASPLQMLGIVPSLFSKKDPWYFYTINGKNYKTKDLNLYLQAMEADYLDIHPNFRREGIKNPFSYKAAQEPLSVHFIDVGQGDSTFIQTEQGTVLIDTGRPGEVHKVILYLQKLGIEEIDYLVVTHDDLDHIGGLKQVMESFKVHNVISAGVFDDTRYMTKNVMDLYVMMAHNNVNLIEAHSGQEFLMGDARLKVLTPSKVMRPTSKTKRKFEKELSEMEHENNVVTELTFMDVSMLFMGDAEESMELSLVPGMSSKYDILKVAHHGSAGSSESEFLSTANPQYAIVSAGFMNMYGHPASEVVERLNAVDAKTLSTADKGNIVIGTDGEHLTVSEQYYKTYLKQWTREQLDPIGKTKGQPGWSGPEGIEPYTEPRKLYTYSVYNKKAGRVDYYNTFSEKKAIEALSKGASPLNDDTISLQSTASALAETDPKYAALKTTGAVDKAVKRAFRGFGSKPIKAPKTSVSKAPNTSKPRTDFNKTQPYHFQGGIKKHAGKIGTGYYLRRDLGAFNLSHKTELRNKKRAADLAAQVQRYQQLRDLRIRMSRH